MPHATTGTAHACPGASGPVSLKNGNVIPAGNCIWMRMSGRRSWCKEHEHFCQLHNWTYSKKDECKHCVSAKNARKKEMDDARKKKRDDDDEGRKAPKKSRKGGVSSPSKEMATPSLRKTRSMTKKEAETKGATKGATKGVTKAEHIDFWMSGKKLDISRLIKNTIHSPDTDPPPPASYSEDSNCAYSLISQQHANLLAAFELHFHHLPA